MGRLRIHHVVTSLDIGGAERHVWSLARSQSKSGHHVQVTYLKGAGQLTESLAQAGVPSASLGVNGWMHTAPVRKLRRTLQRTKPHIVHTHLFPAEVFSSLASVGSHSWRLVTTKHNDEEFLHRQPYGFLHRLVSGNQDAAICPSHHLRSFTLQVGIKPGLPIFVIPYGIDQNEPTPSTYPHSLRKNLGLSSRRVLLGYVGRFVPQKGLDVLIEAFARVRQEIPCSLILAGQGPLEKSLRDNSDRLGVAADVVFAGFHPDPWPVYRALDIFVLPSLWEGFGRVLLEAMLVKLPVVASRTSSIPEIVEDGRTGILVPPGDPDSLARALVELVGSRARRIEMGRRGWSRVKADYSLGSMVAATESAYRSVLN